MLEGNTLFAGDSMTVGLKSFVTVNGPTRAVAEVSRRSDWLVQAIRAVSLATTRNLVVLIGANDIGGVPPEQTIANTLEVWRMGKAAGANVIGQTLPPVKGWAPFASNFDAINARRKAVNFGLSKAFAEGKCDVLLDLSSLMADPGDPEKLSPAFDSGDHLHPRKDAHGALLSRLSVVPMTPGLAPGFTPSLPSSSDPMPLLLMVGACGMIAYLLTRKRSAGLGWR
jgi:lysophospholipase L1-like esterase